MGGPLLPHIGQAVPSSPAIIFAAFSCPIAYHHVLASVRYWPLVRRNFYCVAGTIDSVRAVQPFPESRNALLCKIDGEKFIWASSVPLARLQVFGCITFCVDSYPC